jgi:hypothetical protein
LSVVVVNHRFHDGLANALAEAAMNLSFHQKRIHDGAAIVDGVIFSKLDPERGNRFSKAC